MKFGVNIPPFDAFADVQVLIELAQEAEAAGWDAFFIWDHILFDDLWHPMADPWIALAAIAAKTKTMRIGTMVTPLARRRPWKLARETVSLDRLSNGRFTLGVGLGDPATWEYGFFGEETDAKVRAEMLDEGLEILAGLWSGEPFGFSGKHHQLQEMRFLPTPHQSRIPVWVAGYWPRKRPFRRAARWDGICPGKVEGGALTPDDWREIMTYIDEHRTTDGPFDFVHSGVTSGAKVAEDKARVGEYTKVGVNWWIEGINPYDLGLAWADPWTLEVVEQMKQRIRLGPPK